MSAEPKPSMVSVDPGALYALLSALSGPPHRVRELQATRGLPGDQMNPIDKLVEQYNAFVQETTT